MGGWIKMWAIPTSLITQLSAGELTLSGTSSIVEIYCTPGTVNYDPEEEPAHKQNAGSCFNHKITGFIPRINSTAESEIELLRGRRFVVLLLDGNEEYIVAGTATQPLRFSYSYKRGNETSDLNGYSIIFEGKTIDPPMIVTDPF